MMNPDRQSHWNNLYATKPVDAVSWYQLKPEKSLELIQRFMPAEKNPSVIDVGGGASTLVDHLRAAGYESLSVLDISEEALTKTRTRLGPISEHIKWIVADVTNTEFPDNAFDLWHDRAVFHFLVDPEEQNRYVHQLTRSLKPGGILVISTFAPDGPEKCSGLTVSRHDCADLRRILGQQFDLLLSDREIHQTPFKTVQAFCYCVFRKC